MNLRVYAMLLSNVIKLEPSKKSLKTTSPRSNAPRTFGYDFVSAVVILIKGETESPL